MDTDYAWAAGFLDGEGTISVKRFFRYRKDGSKYLYYQPFVSASQVTTYERPLIKLQDLFGGSLSRYKAKGNRTAVTQWIIVSNDALNCIAKVHQYLQVKKDHAQVLKDFGAQRIVGKGGSGKVTLTQEESKKREEFFNRSRLLSLKGINRLQRLSEETL